MRRLFAVACLWSGLSAFPAEFFVDPNLGNSANPGTALAPWRDLEAVLASGKSFDPADTIFLLSGNHGSPSVTSRNGSGVTICSAPGHTPVLRNLVVSGVSNWTIQGLTITPEPTGALNRRPLVSLGGSVAVVLQNCRIYSITDSSGWSADDWNRRSLDGVNLSGTNCLVRSNYLLNVNFGIAVTGASNVVEKNVIENFSGDGIRGLGDFCIYQFNFIKNAFSVNKNHADGFQSWSRGPAGVGLGTVRGVVLRGNVILNYQDESQPFRAQLQGIGCFDGFYEDWLIENNVIIVDNFHGITLAGARRCRILNNTVVDINRTRPGPPKIKIADHKGGAKSSDNTVRNNLAFAFDLRPGAAISDHNLAVKRPESTFLYFPVDLRLKRGSPAVDAGSSLDVPSRDITGATRPRAGAFRTPQWDVGAFEYDPTQKQEPRTSFSDLPLPW